MSTLAFHPQAYQAIIRFMHTCFLQEAQALTTIAEAEELVYNFPSVVDHVKWVWKFLRVLSFPFRTVLKFLIFFCGLILYLCGQTVSTLGWG